MGLPLVEVERVLGVIHTFDPTGIGARSLAECLALQAKEADRYDPCIARLLANLDLLAKGALPQLRRICGVDEEDMADMIRELRSYDPKPGLRFSSDRAAPVTPDLFVRPTADGWAIEINSATLPRVLINRNYYVELASGKQDKSAKAWLADCLASANWLVKALDQRQKTIIKVASEIVRCQEDFFRKGVAHLKPLTLRTVADTIKMHESTVSRVTSNKYLSCPRGQYELKYFFTSGVSNAEGDGSVSAEAVKSHIKTLIMAEEPQAILSDDTLVELLLLIDAVDGPMPQTRFVTRKALALGLKPIVVVNKIDRPGACPDWVISHTFDLFDKLGATEEQLDFPVVFASALNGFAMLDATKPGTDMRPLYEAIVKHTPQPDVDVDQPLQLQICSLDYNSYVGRIGIGRIQQGRMKAGQEVAVMYGDESKGKARIGQIMMFTGLEREQAAEAEAGDIVLVTGIEQVGIGVTICDPAAPIGMPPLVVDEPTLTMNFQVNTSPLAGKEGKYVTSRQIRERLNKELLANVALRVEETDDADVFLVSGRGELHLTILLETMRREGYELAVSRPRVLFKDINGEKCEPYELLTVDIENDHQGSIMEELGRRRGELLNMESDSKGRVRLEYRIPARGLIGFQGEFLTATRGTGMASHIFDDYGPVAGTMAERRNGVLISQDSGTAVAYALWKLQDRGRMFVSHGDPLYEGIIIGIHSRDNDLVVNPIKGKQLTNVRSSGTDEAVRLVPPILMTLESAVEFIADDELVEITPKSIRLRKRFLKEHERKKANREEPT